MSEEKEENKINNKEMETLVENNEESETEVNTIMANKEKAPFFQVLKSVFIDEIVVVLSSVVLLYVLEMVLKLAGFYIAEKMSMLFIVFVATSILYPVIMENSKYSNTIGKKLSNLKLSKIE